MDQLPQFGRSIADVLAPTLHAYAPLVKANATNIEATSLWTYRYGANPRQKLDIYSPPPSTPLTTVLRPILVFLYGGGFIHGNKIDEANPLFYKNLGYFFSQNAGFETIVIDYRLVKHDAKFPSGAEDLALALNWIKKKYSRENRRLYILGNSAGGVHVCTWLFEPAFEQIRRSIMQEDGGPKLASVILLGVPYHFTNFSLDLRQRLALYLGDNVDDNSPIMSVRRCAETGQLASTEWPPILVVDSELDPNDILRAGQDFIKELEYIPHMIIRYLNAKGHNHISPPLALGTGITVEEDWAYRILSILDSF